MPDLFCFFFNRKSSLVNRSGAWSEGISNSTIALRVAVPESRIQKKLIKKAKMSESDKYEVLEKIGTSFPVAFALFVVLRFLLSDTRKQATARLASSDEYAASRTA